MGRVPKSADDRSEHNRAPDPAPREIRGGESEEIRDAAGSAAAKISRSMVHIHSKYYGRGPTRARTIWRDDVVVTVLEDLFTAAEHTLVNSGHFGQVRATRQTFQDQIQPLMRQAVEEATGREVVAFMSQVSPQDVGLEFFMLRPAPISLPFEHETRAAGMSSAAPGAAADFDRL